MQPSTCIPTLLVTQTHLLFLVLCSISCATAETNTITTVNTGKALALATTERIEAKVKVLNTATGQPVNGALVKAAQGEQALSQTYSNGEGRLTLLLPVPTEKEVRLSLVATHEDFTSSSTTITLVPNATTPSYQIELIPKTLSDCKMYDQFGVIVGKFQMPGTPHPDLSIGIARALEYSILPQLQQFELPTEMQPWFLACDGAQPPALAAVSSYAKSLRADAFVGGHVTREATGTKYRLQSYVGDSHGLFNPPVVSESSDVNLDRPLNAKLANGVQVAILTALVAGYEARQQFAGCVIAATVAQELLDGPVLATLNTMKARCQNHIVQHQLLTDVP